MKLKSSEAAGRASFLLGIFFFQTIRGFGCGPDFPNQLLDRGDDAVLAAPIANFDRELQRMQLSPPSFPAVVETNDYAVGTMEADLADLRSALRKTELSKAAREEIVSDYETQRSRLARSGVMVDADTGDGGTEQPRAETVSGVVIPSGLPDEFSDYFLGCIAWKSGRTNEARAAWTALLRRPPKERQYHSTWATYMLGRSWQGEDPAKAIRYFQEVRSVAKAGFEDRPGLAVASLGWEAQVELRRKHFQRAIELYLQQFAAGDPSARLSLRFAAAAALRGSEAQLICLATNAHCRRVITTLLISYRDHGFLYPETADEQATEVGTPAARWLEAVEAAKVSDVESAEQLALAAYQSGHWQTAARWIRRAKSTPVTQWLQAKLLLYSGKVDEAAALLETVARSFPVDPDATNRPPPTELGNNIYMPGYTYVSSDVFAPDETLAEVGVLRLARREYVESLDALLRSGFWMDAAYVAERVLTLDELKSYVDRYWPVLEVTNAAPRTAQERLPIWPMDVRQEIRYLLARRLTRMERGNEALAYYPAAQQADFQALVAQLQVDANGSTASDQRADALYAAAQIVQAHGMDLIGTEVEPDWRVHGGGYDYGVTVASRGTNDTSAVLVASHDEVRRAAAHKVVPEERYHYRYQAAALAWEAAGLMPNNVDQTARVLCTAGTWLKSRNPQVADVFYKSLVRRCRRTEIGRLADRMRWFPDLDQNGNAVPWAPEPPIETAETPDSSDNATPPRPGYWFVLHRGNTLQDVADAVRASHQLEITAAEIDNANPEVNSNQLRAGQRIFVPAGGLVEDQETTQPAPEPVPVPDATQPPEDTAPDTTETPETEVQPSPAPEPPLCPLQTGVFSLLLLNASHS